MTTFAEDLAYIDRLEKIFKARQLRKMNGGVWVITCPAHWLNCPEKSALLSELGKALNENRTVVVPSDWWNLISFELIRTGE